MISVFRRVVVLSVVLSLFICVSGAPISIQDILQIFGNPVRDFKNSFAQPSLYNSTKSETIANTTTKKDEDGPSDDTSMIEVPPNTAGCQEQGTYLDKSGVCRRPW